MWEELGIGPTQDPKAIRRAYAVRLKQIDPDRNPQAFTQLRAAFEAALADTNLPPPVANAVARRPDTAASQDSLEEDESDAAPRRSETGPQSTPPVEMPAPPLIATLSAEQRARFRNADPDAVLVAKLEQALARNETSKAIALYGRVAASGALSLKAAPALRDKLLALAASDPEIGRDEFLALVESFAWNKLSERDQMAVESRDHVKARLAAERWYDELLAVAGNKTRRKRHDARIAEIMLGRRRLSRFTRIDIHRLKSALDMYELHHTWLPGRFDPKTMAAVKRSCRRRSIIWLSFYLLLITALFLNGARIAYKSFEATNATSWLLIALLFMVGGVVLWLVNAVERLLLQDRRSTGGTAPAASPWLASALRRLRRRFRKEEQDGRT